ncbi:DNA repair exonuclease [uncultured Anaerococcus sp.]|uniref:metallophosphoesterase family protein n=1 Tax=uncultured Anaerococcus sp. TaxID=293428 RepID=UPI0025E0A2EF|nr:DNA repair exonuclease [uncultured Anaerococcus sp.]
MRFIHLADCHLGDRFDFKSGLSDRIRANKKKSLENILNNNRDVDFLLVGGDLYERSFFTLKDYKNLFALIEGFGKDVFYVAGNHDYIGDDNRAILKMKPDKLHIFKTSSLEYFEVNNTRIYGISYDDRLSSYDFPYDINLDDNYFNILLVHASLNDPNSPYLNLNLDRLKKANFDYVALGHIHKREDLNDGIFYPGSIEPSDFSDVYDYGYILYDKGEISHVDSSIMKFYDLDLSKENFKSELDLISQIDLKLDKSKENYLRLKLNDNITSKKLKEKLKLAGLEIKISQDAYLDDLVDLYPNSLLEKYRGKFSGDLDQIERRALELGLDAIYRSRND